MNIKEITTNPIDGQKPGTTGLRKKVSVYEQHNYLKNYIQCIFDELDGTHIGKTLVIGGDGRYFSKHAVQVILKMAIANGWKKIIIGENGLLSTPATSHVIRKYGAFFGIILTSSHNPGGKNGDFGVKTNLESGAPAPEKNTNRIFELTKTITSYKIADTQDIDISKIGSSMIGDVELQVISTVNDYAELMQTIFDFNAIKSLFASGFTMRFDAMNAVAGPYGINIFEEILGAKEGTVVNGVPMEDFGGLHPDPNPVYAKHLFDFMMSNSATDFAAACDGDGDRNMILGRDFYVSPSDSVAVMVANHKIIPAFENGLDGVARSMPTTRAVDWVAKDLGIKCYETPTGWKYFGNLMEANLVTICAEESYGTGANHIREKDGIWAILYWLNMLAVTKKSVKDFVGEYWSKYGRNYYMRHDYEGIDKENADKLIDRLRQNVSSSVGQKFGIYTVVESQDFSYTDPVDGYVTANQGIITTFDDGSRIIMRLSGTGTVGATLRVYFEKYQPDADKYNIPVAKAMDDLVPVAEAIALIKEFTGRNAPDVIVAA